jgi:hypothetical protein
MATWWPLAGRSVTLWPDADAPGRKAMARLAALLAELGCRLQLVEPAGELPQGWDLADADWSALEAAEHLGQWARPLPPDGEPAPAAVSAVVLNSPRVIVCVPLTALLITVCCISSTLPLSF